MNTFEKEPMFVEETDEEFFQRYMEDLRILPSDFDKKILDVGAGSAQFAKWAKEHGVSDKIFSLDPMPKYLEEKEKSVAARAEAMPFGDNSFDIVVSNCAIPNMYAALDSNETIKQKTEKGFREMLRVLKPGGEIRLAGVLFGERYDARRILSRSIEEILSGLENNGYKIEKIPDPRGDLYETDRDDKPIRLHAKSYLVIIKKPEEEK
jgi:SAM-dependent methyltransferase